VHGAHRIAPVTLDELVADATSGQILGDASVEIESLAYDNRRVSPGALFFCVPGERADGHDFASGALGAGAVGLVVERELDLDVAQVVVSDARAAMAPLAARFWGDPTGELKVVGVTGTNGKTTTAFLIREILEAAGIQCGLLGTVKQVVCGVEEDVERTTPEAIDLQATFRRMQEGGDRVCAMEVSSHALALHRCDSIHFDVALFTNLTQDHLDFHRGGMEDYFETKQLLFETGPRISIVNVDDPYGRRLAEELPNCITFSAGGASANIIARNVELTAAGADFEIVEWMGGQQSAEGGRAYPPAGAVKTRLAEAVRTRLPGEFNVANALGAFAAATRPDLEPHAEPDAAAAALARMRPPPGRMEPIDEGQGFGVLVDYAHTPDSLKNVLLAVRGVTEGRVIAVFGAGGDRDRGKRPLMGRAGAEGSDLAIITSDNPRSEGPTAIIDEILAGIDGRDGIEVEPDRRAAITLALELAQPGDMVVIAGKGHEQGQEFEDGRRIPFDDREVARQELRRL